MPKNEKNRVNARQTVKPSKKKPVNEEHQLKTKHSHKPRETAESHYWHGKKFADQQLYIKAIEHYQAAITALDEIKESTVDDWRKRACYQSSLADVYLIEKNSQLSIFYFTQAIASLEKIGKTLGEKDFQTLANFHFNIGMLSTYQRKQQLRHAIEYENKIEEKKQDHRLLFKCYFEMGNLESSDESSSQVTLHRIKDNYNQAIVHGNKIKNISNQEYRLLSSCHNNLGNIFIFLDEHQDASEHFYAAIKLIGSIHDKTAEDLKNIGNTYYNLKRLFKGSSSYQLIFEFGQNVFSDSKDAKKEAKRKYFHVLKLNDQNDPELMSHLLPVMEIIRDSLENENFPNKTFTQDLKKSKNFKIFDEKINKLKQALGTSSTEKQEHNKLFQLFEKRMEAIEAENKKLYDKNLRLEQTIRELQLQLEVHLRRKSDEKSRHHEIDSKNSQDNDNHLMFFSKKGLRTASSASIEKLTEEKPLKA